MHIARLSLLLVVTVCLSEGCASLNTVQRSELRAMRSTGVAVEEKKPVVGAALGLLPGGGSFYTRQWGLGVVDVLLWPTSILWDPIAGYQGAEVINYDISRDHAKKTRARELAALEQQLVQQQIDQVAFVERRRLIEERFEF